MQKVTIGVVALVAAIVLVGGAAAAHGISAVNESGQATTETSVDEQQEECKTMMAQMDDCPMADSGMMDSEGVEQCQEMMDNGTMDEMNSEMMKECQEMMSDGGMGSMMNGSMMNGDGSGMGCH